MQMKHKIMLLQFILMNIVPMRAYVINIVNQKR